MVAERYKDSQLLNTDYALDFVPCKQVSGYFGHVSSLSDKLEQEFDKQEKDCNEYSTGGFSYKNCDADVEIKVKAGEIIGAAAGQNGQAALDLGMLDYRIDSLQYANQERWGDKSLSTVCPLDYFSAATKEKLFAKVGDLDQKRMTPPICGRIDQDIPGTAQGVWFKKGTPLENTYPEDPHLALVHDNIDYSQPIFSVGNSVQQSGLEAEKYFYDVAESGEVNRDFGNVMPGKMYCFENIKERFNPDPLGFIILVELPTKDTLKIEKQNKSSCGSSSSLTGGYSEFER